ncbi:MAG: UDP-N-acetylmuramoyl-L-alanyl-D-glutamate--2,6-diaminopimelate ligase [Chitinispirillia bacterium]|nr:UDP-N-acetylmuramoyl-L-alanyl-D-glutamate--2,6-diaminopimelate ligase [Chitinispirillia bacterium]MCL2267805.1 UDP-N-acetylmuramoyl-L-alanyl-D-glutamate--2,6-diaminopimelate ligase [Chitinispirillia bacterium]
MMRLNELLNASGLNVVERAGDDNPVVSDVVYDSRCVRPGAVYVAIPGIKAHGDTFIEPAIKSGAAAVISENRQEGISAPCAVVKDIRTAPGVLGKALWGIDLPGMTTVGVTGTNGKTTTAYLFKYLLDCFAGGDRVWMFGTVENCLGSERVAATHTTPESVDIFRLISEAKVTPKAISMEVSSHSLALNRVAGMEFDVAVWTNLTQDHLDFHGSMENYYQAKKLIFVDYLKGRGCAVINVDDEYGGRLAGELKGMCRVLTYGRAEDADVRIAGSKCDWSGTAVDIVYDGCEYGFTSLLRGAFNVYNMTAMIAGAFSLGIGHEIIAAALAATRVVSGRMDKVEIDAPFTVIVDYAHTPDALVNILKTSSDLTSGRLICVFGCGGDRDRTKRPLMAKAVAQNCDMAVVTSDNPRSEKPDAIIAEIVKGMPLDFPYTVVADRREAINSALRSAKPGDCVVIAGKGHETYQEICGTRYHFDDREEVINLYRKMVEKNAE